MQSQTAPSLSIDEDWYHHLRHLVPSLGHIERSFLGKMHDDAALIDSLNPFHHGIVSSLVLLFLMVFQPCLLIGEALRARSIFCRGPLFETVYSLCLSIGACFGPKQCTPCLESLVLLG